jgi:hypothetical protein
MSTPPTPSVWTLNASGINGGSNGKLLAGCHIILNAAGTAYEFTAPNISHILSTAGPPLPTPAFTFPEFEYKGFEWIIEVISLPVGATGSGAWSTPPGDESGEFILQAGGIMADDEAASSASAY